MKRTPLPARKSPIGRTGIKSTTQDGRISRTIDAGEAESVRVSPTTQKTSKLVKSNARAKKRPFRFGGIPQNPKYLSFIRTQPCVLFGKLYRSWNYRHVCSGRIEAANCGIRGYGQKAADETALPMCCAAHRTGTANHHEDRYFFDRWGINRDALIESHQASAIAAGVTLGEKYLESIKDSPNAP